MNEAICQTSLPGLEPVARGKVRDIYEVDDRLIIVATDRISAFDWVNPVGIPDKGKIITQIALFWFEQMKDIVPNHIISSNIQDFPEAFQAMPEVFDGRSMLVHKCEMFPVEFVIRGYLAGSGLKEYQQTNTVCGMAMPEGLVESSKLDQPLYTPATKATDGHDINISPEKAAEIIGEKWNSEARDASQKIYARGRDIAAELGIILCDTKFEFGVFNDQLMLADEVLTPDSSRFWPADVYEAGKPQPSFDKQFVRDYLSATDWDKNSPQPALPEDVVLKTREKYMDAYRLLTGKEDL
jgi:phosphoribosylaminoimidazole-succinocarboxamide synthase